MRGGCCKDMLNSWITSPKLCELRLCALKKLVCGFMNVLKIYNLDARLNRLDVDVANYVCVSKVICECDCN